MIHLNIQTSAASYTIAFPPQFAAYCTVDLWYAVEALLPPALVDDLVDYRRAAKGKGKPLTVDFRPIINAGRRECILRRPRKPGEHK